MNLKSKFKNDANQTYNSNKGGFVSYLNLEKYKVEKLKFEIDKDYVIDILPFLVETKNHPQKDQNDYAYNVPFWAHIYFGVENGNYLCMKKTYKSHCPICDEFERLKTKYENEGSLKKEEIWKKTCSFYPKQRVLYHILFNDKKFIADLPYKGFEEVWNELTEKKKSRGDDVFPIYDSSEGSVSLAFSTKEVVIDGKSSFKYTNFDFCKINNFDKKNLEDLISLENLLVIPNIEDMEKIINGEDIQEDEELQNNYYVKDVLEKEVEHEKVVVPKKKNNSSCNYNLKFGIDWDAYEFCDDCKDENSLIYENCQKENKKIR